MRTIKSPTAACGLVLAAAALFLLPACSLNVKKGQNGEEKQVDIKTPMGGIHVTKAPDPQEVGIPFILAQSRKTKTQMATTRAPT